MAEVPVTINGVICDLYGRTITGPIKLVGSMSRTGLGVGGGPIYPPPDGGEEGRPPGIWGGSNEGFPTHPGPLPPTGIWPGGHPEHPIVLPPTPPDFPNPPSGGIKPPPPEGGWGFSPEYGWGYFPGPTEPSPKG